LGSSDEDKAVTHFLQRKSRIAKPTQIQLINLSSVFYCTAPYLVVKNEREHKVW